MKIVLTALLLTNVICTPLNAQSNAKLEKIELNAKKKEKQEKKAKNAQELLESLQKKNSNVTEILVFDEDTDVNNLLGRPGEYIGKADFSDARVQEYWTTQEEKEEMGLQGGTIEVFKTKKDCNKRLKYLKSFMGSDLGVIGLQQYVYKYDKIIFRVSYDITPSEAEIYKKQMDEIVGKKGKVIEPE